MSADLPDKYSASRSWRKVVVKVLHSASQTGYGYGTPDRPFARGVVDEYLVYRGGFVDIADERETVGDHLAVIGNDDRFIGEC